MMKKKCAKAALELINDNTIIGLGGGSTISYLINYISDCNLSVKVVTPSLETALHCKEVGLEVLPTWLVNDVDIAFDGCDEVDEDFHALKSGGAIHTKEKIIGAMAKNYVLLVDESKFHKKLIFNVPVVLEVLPDAYCYVKREVEALGAVVKPRKSSEKDGMIISDFGNMIVDAYFKNVNDIAILHTALSGIVGIVDTSLFYNVVSKVIIASEQGIKVIEKDKEK